VESLTAVVKESAEYNTPEEAAQRRSAANLIGGSLDIEAARILTSRGIKTLNNGKVCWRYDPCLKNPSRSRLHCETLDEFIRNIDCPTLFIVTGNGLFEKAVILGQYFFTKQAYILFILLYLLAFIGSYLPLIGTNLAKILPKIWLGFSLARRVRLINRLQVQFLEDGGHHPHLLLTKVQIIAKRIVKFIEN